MKKVWQIETTQYVPRISKALEKLEKPQSSMKEIISFVGKFERSEETKMAFSLANFAMSGAIVVDQLIDNVRLLWSEGRMVGISGPIRFSLEYWGAIHFGKQILLGFLKDNDIEKAGYKTARLTFSGKTPVKVYWGGTTSNDAYSVMMFVEELAKSHPKAKDDYNFLSEATHPNFLHNVNFILASRVYDNFSHEGMEKHAHEVLEETIQILGRVADGVANDTEELIKLAVQLLQKA